MYHLLAQRIEARNLKLVTLLADMEEHGRTPLSCDILVGNNSPSDATENTDVDHHLLRVGCDPQEPQKGAVET